MRLTAPTLAAVLAGCAAARPINLYRNELMARASFDLACPEKELIAKELGAEKQVGVEGCGKRTSYAWNEKDGNWQK